MARYTRKARNTSGNNRHSNANTQFSSGVHSGRRDMHDGNGNGDVREPCPPGMSPCPDGTCVTTGTACPPPQRGPIVTTGGQTGGASQSYRRGGRVNRRFKPVRSNPRRRR